MPIYLPEKGIKYPNNPKLEILSQIASDELDESGNPLSYIEVYEKDCGCGEARCKQDKWKLCWKSSDTYNEYDYDMRDLIDTVSVISQALSIIAQRNNEY